ncbi:MAG: phosphate signaling complex protein PhoU [Candidatus Brocadiia bacterium]
MSIHLLHEVEKLKKRVLTLGALVEEQVRKSVEAAVKRDEKLAAEVIAADQEIDRMEVDIEEDCLKVLALYQVVAGDLRFIIAILKMNSDLERIGDLAVNIAERAQFLSNLEPDEIPFNLREMAAKAQTMLKKSLDALVNRDVALAYRVCAADEEVDNVNRQAYAVLMEAVQKNPPRLKTLIHQFTAMRQLERIADHATNIAEDVIYMLQGEIVRHRAEKYSRAEPPRPQKE